MQAAEPFAAEYVPGSQGVQRDSELAPETLDMVPAGHWVQALELSADHVPGGQYEQYVRPLDGENRPAGHVKQDSPWRGLAMLPGAQGVHDGSSLPRMEPRGHCVHAGEPALDLVPAWHLEHARAPTSAANVPAGHCRHTDELPGE